jgi:Tfp pilus assembly protein PilN
MSNINFVPDDYVQSNESRRANLMCLILFSVVMAALGGSFVTIKIRQRACGAEESLVNARMAKMEESIKQFEELQSRRQDMMQTALTTAELLEPIPRSVLLASLTNTLPPGVSLIKLDLVQKQDKSAGQSAGASKPKYQTAQSKPAAASETKTSQEDMIEIHMNIEGIAPSDLQVASYIEHLSNSILVDDVDLVESKEKKIEDVAFRQFKLSAMLNKSIHLTKEDIDEIRLKAERTIYQF